MPTCQEILWYPPVTVQKAKNVRRQTHRCLILKRVDTHCSKLRANLHLPLPNSNMDCFKLCSQCLYKYYLSIEVAIDDIPWHGCNNRLADGFAHTLQPLLESQCKGLWSFRQSQCCCNCLYLFYSWWLFTSSDDWSMAQVMYNIIKKNCKKILLCLCCLCPCILQMTMCRFSTSTST